MSKEVMQMALDALEYERSLYDLYHNDYEEGLGNAIKALRAALAPPKLEHDLKDVRCESCGYMTYHREHMGCIRAALAQPKKEWVELTEREITEGNVKSWVDKQAWESAVWWAEAKLKDKNT
jgi:hypothetical protein